MKSLKKQSTFLKVSMILFIATVGFSNFAWNKLVPEATAASSGYLPTCLEIYPNPCAQEFTIQLPDNIAKAKVRISDFMGVIMKEVDVNSIHKLTFDISAYNEGIYFVSVITESKTTINKLVIRR
jgi:hypothetical protein